MPSEKEKMLAGELYRPDDPELAADSAVAEDLLRALNATTRRDATERARILGTLLGRIGRDTVLRVPLHVDYGYNVFLGDGVFLNFGCVFLDICPIHVGHRTQVGPYVQFLAADHPRDATTRASGLEFGRPIDVGRNVWIGGGAILLPGVTVGDGAVIGAGAVVTRDVAAGATVVGAPAGPVARRPRNA